MKSCHPLDYPKREGICPAKLNIFGYGQCKLFINQQLTATLNKLININILLITKY
jgi:hypothetical protein